MLRLQSASCPPGTKSSLVIIVSLAYRAQHYLNSLFLLARTVCLYVHEYMEYFADAMHEFKYLS